MNYRSLIDDALSKARSRVAAGVPDTTKEASSENSALRDEATKVADALEYVAFVTADDGSAAGTARAEMIRNFFKTAAEGATHPAVTEAAAGTQAVPPQAGAKKLNPSGLAGGDQPKVTKAPEGTQATIGQDPGKNPSKSAEAPNTLWDLVMKDKGAEKAAGQDQPRVMESTDKAPSRASGGESGAQADAALANNAAPVAAKKKELHAPTRDRLTALFAHARDTAPSMAAAKAVAPKATAAAPPKVASEVIALAKQMAKSAMSPEEMKKKEDEEKKAKEKGSEKKGSLLEYAGLWDASISGQLGDQVKQAAQGIVDAVQQASAQ